MALPKGRFDGVLTAREAAQAAKRPLARVMSAIKTGELRAFRTVGGHRRVRREDLEAWMKAGPGKAPAKRKKK